MNNFNECHNCDFSKTCAQTPEDCETTEDWVTSDTYALVKASEATLASAMEAGQIQVGLCLSLLALKLALKPFQEGSARA